MLFFRRFFRRKHEVQIWWFSSFRKCRFFTQKLSKNTQQTIHFDPIFHEICKFCKIFPKFFRNFFEFSKMSEKFFENFRKFRFSWKMGVKYHFCYVKMLKIGHFLRFFEFFEKFSKKLEKFSKNLEKNRQKSSFFMKNDPKCHVCYRKMRKKSSKIDLFGP